MPHDEVILPLRRGRWLAGLALGSLVSSFVLLLLPATSSRVRSTGADGYSVSAIGHAGLLQLLRAQGEPVVQMRHVREMDHAGLLVIAEPGELKPEECDALHALAQQAVRTLFVLPKREGAMDPRKQTWIKEASLLPLADAGEALHSLLAKDSLAAPELVRVDACTAWESSTLADGAEPTLVGPVQLFARGSTRIEPWLECAQGILLGRIGDWYVLSDPDLLANHGIVRGANAAITLAVLQYIKAGGAIVFDETCHGHRREPSFWHELGTFPLVLVPAQLLLMLTLVLWIASARFGASVPSPPAIEPGKRFLIENAVALLDRASLQRTALQKFRRLLVRRAAERLQVPRGSTDEACLQWLLARMPDPSARQELATLCEATRDPATGTNALSMARRLHELTQGNNDAQF